MRPIKLVWYQRRIPTGRLEKGHMTTVLCCIKHFQRKWTFCPFVPVKPRLPKTLDVHWPSIARTESNRLGFLNQIPAGRIAAWRFMRSAGEGKYNFKEEGTKGGNFGPASVLFAQSDGEIIVFTSG